MTTNKQSNLNANNAETSRFDTQNGTQKRPILIIVAVVLISLYAILAILSGIGMVVSVIVQIIREREVAFLATSSALNFILLMVFTLGRGVLIGWLAWGLWQMKNWARIILIMILGFAVMSAFTLAGIVGIGTLVIVAYPIYWFITHRENFIDSREDEEYVRPNWEGGIIIGGLIGAVIFFFLALLAEVFVTQGAALGALGGGVVGAIIAGVSFFVKNAVQKAR